MRTTIGALLLLVLLSACQAPMRPMTVLQPMSRNAALAAAYGMPEAPQAAAQRQFKKADANGDGSLVEAEYVAAQMGGYREADAADVRQYLGKQFAGFDTNKDRRLSLVEYIGPERAPAKAPAVKAPAAKAPAAKAPVVKAPATKAASVRR